MPKRVIVVTGGVLSGLGKGIISSSISRILLSKGFSVENLKIDPYLNVDAGTMRPTEHGEVWVTRDGGEIDEDLGHYERFSGVKTSKKNNITSGKIFFTVLNKERKGDYLGKTVEPIPHVTDEIIKHINSFDCDFLVLEVGGVVGDYENILFLEALRILKTRIGKDIVFAHTVYVPIPDHLGEPKTKPAQHSLRSLRTIGLNPDLLFVRVKGGLDKPRMEKISLNASLNADKVIISPDTDLIYRLPLIFEEQNFSNKLFEILGLKKSSNDLVEWKEVVAKHDSLKEEIRIGLVGKYIKTGEYDLKDSYVSVEQALFIAGIHLGKRVVIDWIDTEDFSKSDLDNVCGVVVPGGFGNKGVEGKIEAIRYCRENKIPFLGLCFGLQLSVIEFARNVLGIKNANSEEFSEEGDLFVKFIPEMKNLLQKNGFGASMRLGEWEAKLKIDSKVRFIYGKESVGLRHRHRYEICPTKYRVLEDNGFMISGSNPKLGVCEFMELKDHPFFIGTQAHPEFDAQFLKPEPLFYEFVKTCSQKQFKESN